MRRHIYTYFLILLSVVSTMEALAQEVENHYENRTSAELSYKNKAIKKGKITLIPELRTDENFKIDKSVIKTDLSYKPASFVTFETGYRFIIDNKKTTEYFHQYQFSVRAKKDFSRTRTFFRLRYTNYADDAFDDKNYLRFKVGAAYNIYNCRLTPVASAEVFQDLEKNQRYKMRYALKANYKINDKNALEVGYKFDFYNLKYLNKHIVGIAYLYDL